MSEIKRQVFKGIIKQNTAAFIIFLTAIVVSHLFSRFPHGLLDLRFVVLEAIFIFLLFYFAAFSLQLYFSFCHKFQIAMHATGLHEELISDFQRAWSLWNDSVLLGEKYVYIYLSKTAILPRSEVKEFSYYLKKIPCSSGSSYIISLRTEHNTIDIAARPNRKYRESDIRAEIDYANNLIKRQEAE
ncbi:MAG: hypothetical protein E7240_09585 [Lachnospiraceae bacterium]|nr:hypothetical protein [Lachnospiraceae bacterium]